MLLLIAYALMIAGLANILVALLVFLRDRRRPSNISFFILSFCIAGWAIGIAGFLLSDSKGAALAWAKAYYFFPLVIAVAVTAYVSLFPTYRHLRKIRTLVLILGFALLAVPLLLLDGFLVGSVVQYSWGKEVVLNKLHYLLYSIYILIYFSYALYIIYKKSIKERGVYATQAKFFFVGFLTAAISGTIFDLILPWLGNYRLIWVGPIFTSVFFATIAYSIVRHRMFDVRLVVMRSLGYAVSLAVLASVYGFVVFGAASLLFDLEISLAVQVYISLATAIASLLFGSIKKFFDRQTNRLFYRDAYDAEELFSDVNEVLVSTIDLEKLLAGVSRVIGGQLKAHNCAVVLRHGLDNNFSLYSSDGESKAFHSKDIESIVSLLLKTGSSTWITDYLPEEQAKLMQLLTKHDISLVSLLTDQKHDKKPIGFIMLKPKMSGNSYTGQDMRVIDTIGKELVIAIQNALQFEEIEQFNLTLQHKVEDATKQLRKTNDKLKMMDEAKDDFISMASHQLRTPLTSVKGYISMVLDEDAGKINKMQHKMLDQAFTSAQRMTYLISDLLNVSRLKSGKFVIEPIPVNLVVLVRQEIDQLVETAKVRGLELVFVPPADFPEIMLDETKTRQVIMNFVDNAIYYTPSGGKIEIKLVETERSVELTVVDTGLGVPKHLQHHLFTKFYRAPNAKQARPDGTGLGLFMAKKVIIAQGGSIIFKSTENKGSTFGFNFPKNVNQPDHTPPK